MNKLSHGNGWPLILSHLDYSFWKNTFHCSLGTKLCLCQHFLTPKMTNDVIVTSRDVINVDVGFFCAILFNSLRSNIWQSLKSFRWVLKKLLTFTLIRVSYGIFANFDTLSWLNPHNFWTTHDNDPIFSGKIQNK